jgi:hypothetical protein
MLSSMRAAWFSPVFSQLLEDRRGSLLLAGAGAAHLALNAVGLPGWVCPILSATGVPCPGCGLTTAILELLKGDIAGSLRTHAFAPVILAALTLMLFALILPMDARQRLAAGMAKVETRTGLTAWVMLTLFLYWGARLPGLL